MNSSKRQKSALWSFGHQRYHSVMALTNDDLQAIQVIVQTTIQPMLNGLEDAFTSSIDDAVDALTQSTVAGFAEVHDKLAEHDQRFERIEGQLSRIENKLDGTIDRVDGHPVRIQRLEFKPA